MSTPDHRSSLKVPPSPEKHRFEDNLPADGKDRQRHKSGISLLE
jgi:hypothetical protein